MYNDYYIYIYIDLYNPTYSTLTMAHLGPNKGETQGLHHRPSPTTLRLARPSAIHCPGRPKPLETQPELGSASRGAPGAGPPVTTESHRT